MMNSRRAPTNRVPLLNMAYETGQTIASVCKCMSLDDLVKVWDVRQSIMLPRAAAAGTVNSTDNTGDLHNYDDRYFLDHDTFRKERNEAVEQALAASADGDEKKAEVFLPVAKRPKI